MDLIRSSGYAIGKLCWIWCYLIIRIATALHGPAIIDIHVFVAGILHKSATYGQPENINLQTKVDHLLCGVYEVVLRDVTTKGVP